jgi:two-component system, OmpR family, sensor kinase
MTKPSNRWLYRALLIGSIPFLLGSLLWLALQSPAVPDPVLVGRITAGVSTLALLAGLVLSSLGWAGGLLSFFWLGRSRKALTEERRRHDEGHRRFVHRLEHETKNPLATLQVTLATLEQQPTRCEQENQLMQSGQEQIARLRHLFQNLRKLADLEAQPLEPEPINLAELLSEAIIAVQAQAGGTDRSLTLITPRVPWSPASVLGDPDLLLLVFYNLLDNACKFTCADDTIEVLVREGNTALTVDVADSGPGIAEADLPHVFEELYRGQNAKGVEGSGLGLALAKKIVECHDGQISVRSRLGHGTVFTVRLPLSPEAQ